MTDNDAAAFIAGTIIRLEQIRDLQIGDAPPQWMVDEASGNWGEAISKLCGDAATIIKGFLR